MVGKVTTKINTVGTLPYSHLGNKVTLVITASFFRPGKTAKHFLIKKNVYAITHKYQTVESLIIAPC